MIDIFRRICAVLVISTLSLTAISPEAGAAAATSQKQASSPTIKKAKKTAQPTRQQKNKGKKTGTKTVLPRSGYKGAILYNVNTNKILFSKNAHAQIPPASLTKILAMYVALDTMRAKGIRPETMVTVSAKAARTGGSRMGLQKGDKVRLDHLLRGMAVSSGNDASIAVAEFIGGTEKAFVLAMNKKAKAIGMKNSVFKNANGLPAKGQLTTANDMLLLARSYMRAYPENIKKYHNLKFNVYKGHITSVNANPLLGQFPGADGLKTGYVDAAGYNLIATAQRGGTRLIGVTLGSPSSAVRAAEASSLLEAGFGKFAVPISSDRKTQKKDAAKQQERRAHGKKNISQTNQSPKKKESQAKVPPVKKSTQAVKAAKQTSKDGGKKKAPSVSVKKEKASASNAKNTPSKKQNAPQKTSALPKNENKSKKPVEKTSIKQVPSKGKTAQKAQEKQTKNSKNTKKQ